MHEILHLTYEMSPYILLGFFLAGLMHAFIPAGFYKKYLSGNSVRSVLNAAILSIPIPLCSCGVIPTAMSLRREGASRGATVAFLISTPQTGIDAIIATYSLMGFPFALLRPIIAIITAIFGGLFVNRFSKEEDQTTYMQAHETCSCSPASTPFRGKMRTALRYAFVDMMQDIGKWLIIGLVVAGLITALVPDSFFALFIGKPLLSMLMVLLLAFPMSLCATGSIPIAVALMLKGLSPGTALVLLMAGPAINAASMLVVSKVMGVRTMLLYIASIVLGAITFGIGIDYLLPREWFTDYLVGHHHHEHGVPYFNLACAIVLALLFIHALCRKHEHHHEAKKA